MNQLILGVLAALGSAFGWAVSTILLKIGMRSKSPVSVNIIRLYLVSLFYAFTLLLAGKFGEILGAEPKYLLVAFISAQFGFVIGDYFYLNALHRLGVSRTVPITSTYPLWAVLWAVLYLGRKVPIRVYVGAFLIVLAIIIVKRADDRESSDPLGFVFAILAPVSWSLAITMMDWLTRYFDPLPLAALRMFSAAIGVSFFLPRYWPEVRRVNPRELKILALAAFSGLFLGQLLFVYATQTVGSQVSAPVSAINPLITSLLAVLVLKERPNARIWEGLALAIAGILLISAG